MQEVAGLTTEYYTDRTALIFAGYLSDSADPASVRLDGPLQRFRAELGSQEDLVEQQINAVLTR